MTIKQFFAMLAVSLASFGGAPAHAHPHAPAPAPHGARIAPFPIVLVSKQVDTKYVTLRYYTRVPGLSFCVLTTGYGPDLGPHYERQPACLAADRNGNATVKVIAKGGGWLILNVLLASGEVHTDTLDLTKLRPD